MNISPVCPPGLLRGPGCFQDANLVVKVAYWIEMQLIIFTYSLVAVKLFSDKRKQLRAIDLKNRVGRCQTIILGILFAK